MACFATPYGFRYAAHCFSRANAQKNQPALVHAEGKLAIQVSSVRPKVMRAVAKEGPQKRLI